jgi:methylated-DNA-protein-cysteine methyltransferase-like protein
MPLKSWLDPAPAGAPTRNVFARILAVVRRIPRGRVATYGQVARIAGLPRYARHVGYALHALPHGSNVPWHRVLNTRGAVSLRARDGAAETQRLRLTKEGVHFNAAGRVSLATYQWQPGVRPAAKRAR